MPKVFTYAGMAVGLLLAVVFGFDLGLKIPFDRASPTMDVAFTICGALLFYMSWSTWRELTR